MSCRICLNILCCTFIFSSITNTLHLDYCDRWTPSWNCLLLANFSSIKTSTPPSVPTIHPLSIPTQSCSGSWELECNSSSHLRWNTPWTGHQSITWLLPLLWSLLLAGSWASFRKRSTHICRFQYLFETVFIVHQFFLDLLLLNYDLDCFVHLYVFHLSSN